LMTVVRGAWPGVRVGKRRVLGGADEGLLGGWPRVASGGTGHGGTGVTGLGRELSAGWRDLRWQLTGCLSGGLAAGLEVSGQRFRRRGGRNGRCARHPWQPMIGRPGGGPGADECCGSVWRAAGGGRGAAGVWKASDGVAFMASSRGSTAESGFRGGGAAVVASDGDSRMTWPGMKR